MYSLPALSFLFLSLSRFPPLFLFSHSVFLSLSPSSTHILPFPSHVRSFLRNDKMNEFICAVKHHSMWQHLVDSRAIKVEFGAYFMKCDSNWCTGHRQYQSLYQTVRQQDNTIEGIIDYFHSNKSLPCWPTSGGGDSLEQERESGAVRRKWMSSSLCNICQHNFDRRILPSINTEIHSIYHVTMLHRMIPINQIHSFQPPTRLCWNQHWHQQSSLECERRLRRYWCHWNLSNKSNRQALVFLLTTEEKKHIGL